MIKKQFTLYLENKPGALAAVTRLLTREKINIDGISVSETTDVGLVQLVVSNATKTRQILRKASIPFTTQDVALLTLKNQPGSIARVSGALAKAGVNINYIYATGCKCTPDCECNVIISAPDLKRVEKAWNDATRY